MLWFRNNLFTRHHINTTIDEGTDNQIRSVWCYVQTRQCSQRQMQGWGSRFTGSEIILFFDEFANGFGITRIQLGLCLKHIPLQRQQSSRSINNNSLCRSDHTSSFIARSAPLFCSIIALNPSHKSVCNSFDIVSKTQRTQTTWTATILANHCCIRLTAKVKLGVGLCDVMTETCKRVFNEDGEALWF